MEHDGIILLVCKYRNCSADVLAVLLFKHVLIPLHGNRNVCHRIAQGAREAATQIQIGTNAQLIACDSQALLGNAAQVCRAERQPLLDFLAVKRDVAADIAHV